MRQVPDLDFDVMIEAKAKGLALIRLRADLLRYAPPTSSPASAWARMKRRPWREARLKSRLCVRRSEPA